MLCARPSRLLLTAAAASSVVASLALSPVADAAEPATIAQIQGAAHRSPQEGNRVTGVRGVVTATSSTGFWMQSLTPDEDPATSEGLFVYTRTRPTVRPGDVLVVTGTVTEFRPGGSGGNDNLTTTELTGPTITTDGTAAAPRPVVIGTDRIAPQQTITSGDPGSVENAGHAFAPGTNAIDFYESLEGMSVGVRDGATAVGPTSEHGELPVVPEPAAATRSRAGGVVYGSYAQPNAMRVILDDALLPRDAMPLANVGDAVSGVRGVLDYSFANFKLLATTPPQLTARGLTRESTVPQTNNQLAVATMNVENLSTRDPIEKHQRLARQVVANLRSPDILALEEIQDDSGPQDNGVVDSTATLKKLTDAIRAAGGPAYEARWINPQDKLDGGQPGGNIRNVFLYRTDRDLTFVDRPGGDATTPTEVVGTRRKTALSASPGRVDPSNAAWTDSRKPLAGEFRFRGKTFFVIANHFSSKGGDDPLLGRWQQPTRFSETQRHQQARVVRGFVDKILRADPAANVVVAGDINDFEFSETTDILVGSGCTRMTDLPRTLPAAERYTYVFDGNSQVLDHILISPALLQAPPGAHGPAYTYDIVHTNSDFHDQDSDHDPQLVRLQVRGGR